MNCGDDKRYSAAGAHEKKGTKIHAYNNKPLYHIRTVCQ